MARIGKRTGPTKAKAKPAEKEKRTAAPPKDCCGAIRGHKATCPTLLPSERDDDHGIERIDPTEPDPGQADLQDILPEVSETPVGATLVAALRGIEESFSRIADSMAILAAGGAKTTPVEPQAAPRAPRKPRTPQEPTPAVPTAQEPAQAAEDPGAVDLMDEPAPTPAPAKPAPAPAPKAAPAAPKALTTDEVRTMFLGFASRKGRDAAVAVLSRFNVAKLGELDAKQYPALVAALKED